MKPENSPKPNSFIIKKISFQHIDEFNQLIALFNEDDYKNNTQLASHNYLKNFLSVESNHVIVAYENGDVVGGLTAFELPMYKNETTEMFLFEIDVKSTHRQAGIATQLIEELKKICHEKGITQMFVLTSSHNKAANLLYKATGAVNDNTSTLYSYFF